MKRWFFSLCCAVLVLTAGSLFAQSSAEVNAGVQFNFSNPGARSLALGGAFIGLADDATAAYTNPAGLTILQKPEVSVEGRSNRFTHRFSDFGHTGTFDQPGTLTNRGVDTVAGLQIGEKRNTISDLSFASFVLPQENWAIAFYTHQLADFKADFRTQGFFEDEPNQGLFRVLPATNHLELGVRNYAVAFAVKLPSSLSLGVSANYLDFSLDSTTTRFSLEDPRTVRCTADPNAAGCFFGVPDYSLENSRNTQVQRGSSAGNHRITFNAGLIWRPSSKFNAGFVIRDGSRFKVNATSFAGAPGCFDFTPAGQCVSDPSAKFTFVDSQGYFHVPTVVGTGVVIRPVSAFTIAADLNWIQYGATANGITPLFRDPENDPFPEDATKYHASNGFEYRAGAEYAFTKISFGNALLFRVGTWRDPEHRIRYTDNRNLQNLLFRRGDAQTHISGGVGLAFSQRFEINAAYDHSDLTDTASLSLVTRFQ